MSLNWDEIEGQYGNFKEWAPAGKHKVKVDKVVNRESSTGTIWQDIMLMSDDKYSYPRFSHPLSQKNQNWRAWHWRCLFEELGASSADAKKVVESCESKGDFAKIASAYEQKMNSLASKHPEITIEVWDEPGNDGKIYARADFNSRVRMNRPDDVANAQPTNDQENFLAGAEEVSQEELGDMPF